MDTCVCMYLIIGKGQIAQKDHIGSKINSIAKLKVKISLIVKLSFESNFTASGTRFRYLTTLHAKLLLLRVRPVC